MAKRQEWATPENDEFAGERGLHVLGTRDRGPRGTDYWLYNPPLRQPKYRCGICKEPMQKLGRCPRCYEGIEEAL